MAFDTMPRRPAIFAKCRLFRMAGPAQIVILPFEQGPDILIGRVTNHTGTAARVVVVIMVAKNAVLCRVIRMCK
jgi:hypothetical protein